MVADVPEPISGGAINASARAVIDDFVKGFQVYLDGLKWRELRHCVSAEADTVLSCDWTDLWASGLDSFLRTSGRYAGR